MRKIDRLRSLMAAGDWPAALSLAASFPQLGQERAAIVRGHEAHVHPRFYRQLGHDPEALVQKGIAALRSKYGSRG